MSLVEVLWISWTFVMFTENYYEMHQHVIYSVLIINSEVIASDFPVSSTVVSVASTLLHYNMLFVTQYTVFGSTACIYLHVFHM